MVTWDDIEIRIPTVLPERAEPVSALTTELREQTGESPWLSPHPDGRHPNDRVRRVFGKPVTDDWLLYLEDDIYLAGSFGEMVPHVLEETGRVAVQLFDLRKGDDGLTTARKPLHSMCAIAIRSKIVGGFAEFYYDWIETTTHTDAVDVGFSHYCTELGEPVDVYRPSQVQHREIPSTVDSRSSKRQSPTFEE